MLPRTHRISRKEFPAHTRQGFRVFSPLFTLVAYRPLTESSPSQVSVVVSKKIAKTAVARNRIRRRFYALMELHLKKFSRPATIIIYPKVEAEKVPFALLKTEMEQTLRKARCLP